MNLEKFNKKGYIILKNFFNPETIDRIREDSKDIFKTQFKRFGYDDTNEMFKDSMVKLFNNQRETFINCGKTIQQGLLSLYKISIDDNLINEIKKLGLEKPNICTRPVLFFNHPKLAEQEVYYKTPAHQDWGSMLGSLDSVVIWVPLVDITEGNGPLEIIESSHTKGLVSDSINNGFSIISNVKDDDFKKVKLKKGDILIFSSFLIHRSGEITNDEIRWSCHFRYNNLNDSDFISRGYPNPYIYKPITKS